MIDPSRSTTLVGKIELYLGEYISREALEKLKMAFKSIGQRLGFVSAGDERRAAVKAAEEKLHKKYKAEIAAKDADIAAKDADIAAKDAENRELKAKLDALLAQKG